LLARADGAPLWAPAEQPETKDVTDAVPRAAETKAEIKRLAHLSRLDYDREREAAAKKLGCRVGTLDDEVKAHRNEGAEAGGQGRAFEITDIEPWTESVDGAELLSEVVAATNYAGS
jgi:hypothetical protein